MTTIHNNEITIPYSLYKETVEKSSNNITRYLITHSNYKGVAESSEIRLECEFTIRVFSHSDKESVVVPLLSLRATIQRQQISYISGGAEQDGTSVGACIIANTSSPHYNFFTSKPGLYTIKLTCFVPYLTVKKTGMELSIPSSSNNSISFQVPYSNANIKIFNSFCDIDATNQWLDRCGKEVPTYTIVFAKLPQETQLRIQWTIKTETTNNNNNAVEVKAKPPSIVVVQNTLGSIGEGLLILISKFKYKMVNGSMSLFNLLVDKKLNIINVEGEAVKKWETMNSSNPEAEKANYKQLTVWLDYGVENDYELTVSAEYSMGSTSADVRIPSIRCVGEEITRHRGFIAIEARTNVEISEIDSQNLDVIDLKELPRDLSQLSTFPILLGYKFLDPVFDLNLRVKKNLDVQVLVSICESAHFVTTMSNTGKTIHQYILSIKNTQKQFIRLQIPFDYSLWSSVMDGQPIRPSSIENPQSPNSPTLLVPLLKSGPSTNADTPVQIEIMLLENKIRDISSKKGSLKFMMPKMDLPLRAAYCTIHLPDNVKQGKKFEGNLKNIPYFTQTVPQASGEPSSNNKNYNNNNYDDDDDYYNEKMDRRSSISHNSNSFFSVSKVAKKKSNACRSVIPVIISMPVTTQPSYFEQILVDGEKDLWLQFDYSLTNVKVKR